MNTSILESPLEPLARAVYAMELAGLSAAEPSPETIEAAEQGQAFALSFEFPGLTRLNMRFDPDAGHYEIAVHLRGAYLHENVVLAALRLNHDLTSRSQRFSLEPYSGDVVLSDVLPWGVASPEDLAMCACDLLLIMNELEEMQTTDQLPESPDAGADFMRNAALRG